MKRGILGVRQDAKKQILFSFQVRDGDEWPSDSSDDDFCPEDERRSEGHIVKKSCAKRKRQLRSKVPHEVDSHSPSESKKTAKQARGLCVQEQGWWGHMPIELLHHVFSFVVEIEGAVPFLCRAARTCKLWYEASLKTSLWRHVDLSYGYIRKFDHSLIWLVDHRLSQVEELNLTGWMRANMSDRCVQAMTKCRTLKSLILSGCKKLSSDSLCRIVAGLPNLAHIDLSTTNGDVMSTKCLRFVIDSMGERLTHFDISRNAVMSLSSSVLTSLMTNCRNLRALDISGSLKVCMILDIERLQQGCPLLETLNLTCTPFRPSSATVAQVTNSPGFVHLKQLCIGINPSIRTSCVTDDVLYRLLKTSTKLSLLEARCCRNFSALGLSRVPVSHLQRLYLSHCSPGYLRIGDLAQVLAKWRESIAELDLGWNTSSEQDMIKVVDELCKSHESQLTKLNLCGTAITEDGVRRLLVTCSRLNRLDLSSCRGLPRGMKSLYCGDDLKRLRENLAEVIS